MDLLTLAGRVATETGHDPFDGALHRDLATLGNDHLAQERRLETAALTLRKVWLSAAHRPADASLKSPRDGDIARVPCGDSLHFGYERDLDMSILEDRGAAYAPPPAGWTSDMVIFRSGQAALAAILQFVASAWGDRRTLSVAHAGAYFETRALLDAWPRQNFRPTHPSVVSADVVICEPVWCNGCFAATKRLPRARHVLLIDTTMVGPACDLSPWLLAAGNDCDLAIAFSSGLKLDQAGLELANVGIARVLVRDGAQRRSEITGRLRQLRGLMATGLTLDELSALSAPWFLDRAYVDNYVAAIFANNRVLAHAIGHESPVFGPHCHPALTSNADAPFCAIQLREPSPSRYRRFVEIVEQQRERRGLLLAKGGSFGFRGHRFELIEPAPDQGHPFLRLAMGWRDGHSCRGLGELFHELAAYESFEALDRAYGR
ncbi:hypothetical protein [Reyranella soli]|uniref:hypothetical protein n=1 Tax=Reyranella soli TaxID=1230389 RepID=UPI001478F944|nr:hypothetical protein [Reyranella soli]